MEIPHSSHSADPKNGQFHCSAVASATTANQPAYDSGGFPLEIRNVISGELSPWETLTDRVSINAIPVSTQETDLVLVSSHVQEKDVTSLPDDPNENCASRAVLEALSTLRSHGIEWNWQVHVHVYKGISIKGTGLGSSGASAAAAFKAFEGLLEELGIEIAFSDSEKIRILIAADSGIPDNSISAYFGGWVMFTNADPYKMQRLHVHPNFGNFVFVCPRDFGIETAVARDVLPSVTPDQHMYVEQMCKAIEKGDTQKYAALMERVHAWFVQPRSRLYPNSGSTYNKVYAAAKQAGALGVTISGAGPCLHAIVESEKHAVPVGIAMYDAFASCGNDSVAFLADICHRGAAIIAPQSDALQ